MSSRLQILPTSSRLSDRRVPFVSRFSFVFASLSSWCVAGVFSFSSLFVATVLATDYYVSSSVGSDANSGLSPDAPWRSLDRVSNADELKPGDVVRFRCGDRWRGGLQPKSGEEGRPVVYASYGNGAKPSFLRSVALNDEKDWISVGKNLWATRTPTVKTVGNGGGFFGGDWGIHSENGADARLERIATDGGETLKVVVAESGAAGNHIQLIKSAFPIEIGKTYRVSFDAKSTQSVAGTSVSLMKAGAPWGSCGILLEQKFEPKPEISRQELIFRTTQTAVDGRVTFYLGTATKGTEIELSNFRVEEVDFDALELGPDVGNVILDGKKAAFKRWTIDDLKSDDDFVYERSEGRVWYYSQGNPATRFASIEAATMRHNINLSGVSWAVFDGIDVRYGSAHGFGGSGNACIVIRNCDISWIGGGDQYLGGGEGRRVRYGNGIEFWSSATDHVVENCRIWEVYDAAITNQGSGTNQERNIAYRDNVIWNCEYSFEYWNRGSESITDKIEFVGNLCLFAGYGWGHEQRPDRNGRCLMFYSNSAQTTNFVVRGNVFANATESLVRSDVDWTPEEPRLDGNIYWQDDPTKPLALWKRETFEFSPSGFASYQKAANQESSGKIRKVDAEALVPDVE